MEGFCVCIVLVADFLANNLSGSANSQTTSVLDEAANE